MLNRLLYGALGQNHFRQCNKKSPAGESTRGLKVQKLFYNLC
ncbi:hypothetical protein HMPREF0208_01932 [Citrobacter koseri]|uniref:Uncharacterized protein n=1 Tax=Citrobacter koseri (strain ATCC BAA-895 / CDC 4225-83 / SGSC4696) TaxID=290338 RepID=A8AFJ4_CITK8|nr:hypothetical protein CKO_01114 [Citrobacter koseri ATCC BAA-895]KXA00572.1 hypothetical protein HMPREF3207_03226 [Citrobacter koseri]KXB44581.1 hypothetical protein HMPREF0208_01932 [Citrobacter koseri]